MFLVELDMYGCKLKLEILIISKIAKQNYSLNSSFPFSQGLKSFTSLFPVFNSSRID